MGAETVSTHTVKDGTTTILTRTTTIVSEQEVFEPLKEPTHGGGGGGVVENVRQTFKDYWYPLQIGDSNDDDDDDDGDNNSGIHGDPSFLKPNNVIRRAHDYWKTLTQDADEAAKEVVVKTKKVRDEAAAEAKWAILGYKKEAREAYEVAEKNYKDALAAAERVHEEAHEKAKLKWFQVADTTEREVDDIKDQIEDVSHEKWDRFKAAVNSLAFNPPKYGCTPTTQYWFSSYDPSTHWDCREIWDHPSRNDHRHQSIKTLPKKHIPIEKVHDTLSDLLLQAKNKAKNALPVSSFESNLKPVKDQYQKALDAVYRGEQGAIEDLETISDKIKTKLNEAKYYEEQTDLWLTSQWNSVIENAGDTKSQYERAFKQAIKSIKNTRVETYNSLLQSLQKSVDTAKDNVSKAYHATKDRADKSRLQKSIKDANDSFSSAIKDAEIKIKATPKNAYDSAIESFNRDTAYLKAKLEEAATVASKSASSVSRHASKSGSSAIHHAYESASSLSNHASKLVSSALSQVTDDTKSIVDDAQKVASSKYQYVTDEARDAYEHATISASSMLEAATPLSSSPVHNAQESYRKLVGNVHSQWFSEKNQSEMNISSVYGAILAVYFIFLTRRIWRNRYLRQMSDPHQTTITIVKNSSDDESSAADGNVKVTKFEKFKGKPCAEDALEMDRNSFGSVLTQFTSVVPITLILLAFLELSGFSHVALHWLFVGLITAQFLQDGAFNEVFKKLGIVDGVHASGRDIGTYMSWTVMGLAAIANAVKALQN
ncbi:hypothetical protein BGZ76_002129 [Entomortierella beljakovae]|nr:hypothetical protein BGZ76_002129 [Entomortierella beljakovae]